MKKLRTLREHIILTEKAIKPNSKKFEGDLIGAMRHISDGGVEKFTGNPGGHNVGPNANIDANIQWSPDKKVMDPKDKDNYDKNVHDMYKLLTGIVSRLKEDTSIDKARTGPKKTDSGLSQLYKDFGASSGEPKTDIIFGGNYVSVKNESGAQLMSGQGNETGAIIQSCVINNKDAKGISKKMAKDVAKRIQKAMNVEMFVPLMGLQSRPVFIRLGKQTIEELKKAKKKAWEEYKSINGETNVPDINDPALEKLLKAWGWWDIYKSQTDSMKKKAVNHYYVERGEKKSNQPWGSSLWRVLESGGKIHDKGIKHLSAKGQKEFAEQEARWSRNQKLLNKILGFHEKESDIEQIEGMMAFSTALGIDDAVQKEMYDFFKNPKVYRAMCHEAATGANKFDNKEAVATHFLAWGNDPEKPQYGWHTADEFVDALVKSKAITLEISLRGAGGSDALNKAIHAGIGDKDLLDVIMKVSRGGGMRARLPRILKMFKGLNNESNESWIPLDNSDYQFIQESWNEFERDTTTLLLENWKESEKMLLQEGILDTLGNAYDKVKAGVKLILSKVKGFFMAISRFYVKWVKNVGYFIQAWDMKTAGGIPRNMASKEVWPLPLK